MRSPASPIHLICAYKHGYRCNGGYETKRGGGVNTGGRIANSNEEARKRESEEVSGASVSEMG